jgi:hypothetical protein
MVDRDFTEVDLRHMLHYAGSFREDVVEGRWVLETRHGKQNWEVVVEPEPDDQLLIIITAYPLTFQG